MGRKRSRPWQYVYIYLALLTCVSLTAPGCASPPAVVKAEPSRQSAACRHLSLARYYIAKSDYEASLRESEAALSLCAGQPPADKAIFGLGLIYADPRNRRKNHAKALSFFRQVSEGYPESPYAVQATIWMEVLREDVQVNQQATEALRENVRIKQQLVETVRENKRLKRLLEMLKKVDVETGEMMREKMRQER